MDDFELAEQMFKAFGGFVTGGEAKMYWSAMEYYCALRNRGETNEQALTVIKTLYPLPRVPRVTCGSVAGESAIF